MSLASLALLVALIAAVLGFAVQRRRLAPLAAPAAVAPPRGSAATGVLYAFTAAFAPGAKESASRHLPSYAAGIVFHLSIFAALARLLASLLPVEVPPALNRAAAAVLAAGLACGLALLVKRFAVASLRAISVPDDVVSNLLVNATLAAALASSLQPHLVPLLQLAGAALLLYAPLGKLRHMVLLLTSRRYLGLYFGRRGVRPAPRRPERARG